MAKVPLLVLTTPPRLPPSGLTCLGSDMTMSVNDRFSSDKRDKPSQTAQKFPSSTHVLAFPLITKSRAVQHSNLRVSSLRAGDVNFFGDDSQDVSRSQDIKDSTIHRMVWALVNGTVTICHAAKHSQAQEKRDQYSKHATQVQSSSSFQHCAQNNATQPARTAE
eukprot:1364240-Amphidinium_carterae.1